MPDTLIMKTTIIIALMAFCIFGWVSQVLAQHIKKDTIYYLLDTVNTPRNDQMIFANKTKLEIFFTIDCPCLRADGEKPIFQSINKYQKNISVQLFKSLKLSSVPLIIKLIIENDNGNDFNNKYVLCVVQPVKKVNTQLT